MLRLRALIAAALVTAAAAGCGSPDAGGAELRVGTVANVALAVPLVGLAGDAVAGGYASGVRFVPAANPDEIRANLTSGRVDVAQMPITVATALAAGGVGVQLLGVVDAQMIKVLGPAGAGGWDALRGATVHIPFRGDIAYLVFTTLAQEQGLVPGRDYTAAYGAALPEVVAALATVPAELVPVVLPGLRVRFVDAPTARPDVERLLARLVALEPRIAAAPPSTFFGSGA